ncbi:MAG: 16S rRNA (guanine(527)-N(7))-methyltransferase RsmG [Bacilli bacterium]|nr:16S rRNA (guanine(527)-N(7))-methyltransferase RsmG [Bacilli bacterium]
MNREEFIKETKLLGIELNDKLLSLLEEYYNILKEENEKYNLTRIIEIEDVYLKHFYDSLTITKSINIDNQTICDLGTGAGFPGLVLAICFPNIKLTLIESNGKKCNFLNIVKEKLLLENITIINARVEEYANNNREIFDIVTARAVAPLKHLLEYGVPLVKVSGHFIAMKSSISKEIKNIENYYNKLNIKEENKLEFNLPKENSLRTILKYQKLEKTDTKYPRRYSEMIKRDI